MKGFNMTKLYLFATVVALLCIVYFYGVNIGKSKCEINNYEKQIDVVQKDNNQNIQTKRIVNDQVYKTGLYDIRCILRDKYSIKE